MFVYDSTPIKIENTNGKDVYNNLYKIVDENHTNWWLLLLKIEIGTTLIYQGKNNQTYPLIVLWCSF